VILFLLVISLINILSFLHSPDPSNLLRAFTSFISLLLQHYEVFDSEVLSNYIMFAAYFSQLFGIYWNMHKYSDLPPVLIFLSSTLPILPLASMTAIRTKYSFLTFPVCMLTGLYLFYISLGKSYHFTLSLEHFFLLYYPMLAILFSFLVVGSLKLEVLLYNSVVSTMLQESEEKSQAKTAFISRMSHELRTPLHGLLSSVKLLSSTHLDEDQLSLLDIMNSCGNMILDTIFRILDISKIESGKFESHITRFSLLNMITDICTSFANLSESKKVNLMMDATLDPQGYDVEGDRSHLNEILTNVGFPFHSPSFFSRTKKPQELLTTISFVF